jgi:hypothetical protein
MLTPQNTTSRRSPAEIRHATAIYSCLIGGQSHLHLELGPLGIARFPRLVDGPLPLGRWKVSLIRTERMDQQLRDERSRKRYI